MRIAVIGMGNVGSALGKRWAEVGRQVTFCVRDPNDARKRFEAGKAKAGLGQLGDAAKAETVLLAVPWSAAHDPLKAAGDLSGKVLLERLNLVTPELMHLMIGHSTSAEEVVARLAPQARAVKVFNTNDTKNMTDPDYGGHKVTMLYAGDDEGANRVAAVLAEQIRFEPVYLRPLKEARLLEPLAMAWIILGRHRVAALTRPGRDPSPWIVTRSPSHTINKETKHG
jgi:8-hydroxy-5-deazaflavin:NADPH oxidoreductase